MKRILRRIKRTRQQGGLKRLLQLIFDPTTRQIAAAIRLGETKERNRAARAAQNKPDVWIDKTLQAQAQAQIGCYEPPEKRTDPFATVHQQLTHRRTLMRHNTTSLARKIQLVGNEPETMILASMTAPEDDWTNGGADQTTRHKAVNQ